MITNAGAWREILSWLPVDISLHISAFLLVCYNCLKTRRESASTLLWIFTAWAFPVIGPLFYLFFGINRVPRKALRKHETDRHLQSERRARNNVSISAAALCSARETLSAGPDKNDILYLNRTLDRILPETPLLAGNTIVPLVDGAQAYPAMLQAINNARRHIHLQTFIIGNDETGRQFMEALAARAEEGVKVRFLFDRFGSTAAVVGGLLERYVRRKNMQISGWTQANPLKRPFQINLRNHRKIMVVDGRAAFTGGINLRADNIAAGSEKSIRDYHFMIQGPVVQELQYSFLSDWYFVTEENARTLLEADHFPRPSSPGTALARIVNSGPTPEEMEAIKKVFFECINWSRRELLLIMPYFAPSPDILQALKSAALRGVDVRLLFPRKNNHLYTGLAGKALYEELLGDGVRIFEREPPFMHAKALVADSKLALVGSANMDMRSLRLNYESNLLVFDDAFVRSLRAIVRADFAQSVEIDPDQWRRRPLARKMLENTFYLMTPVL
ncbi:MAG: cardiolipin synthase [Kiritimatiellae bacterium]|nr:cardiolipin synthase [Kiritimatiellia bacterium]